MSAMTAEAWLDPPAELALGPRGVHVWRVALVQPPAVVAALSATLSDDERARAARFYFERDRTAYAVARGALRTLCGRYLGRAAASLEFGYRDKGKPYLVATGQSTDEHLRFNVSHSGDFALIGLALDREIGVDVERRRAMPDLGSLAQASFSPDEYARFCALPPHDREIAFFLCWSRKEAFIKATGEGVSQLAEFDVSLEPGEPAQLLRVAHEPPGAPRWSLRDLPAIPGYAAALVVDGRDLCVACWQFRAPA
jgi:4'-phosphopantetheinyl transferase